jgi:hypothetical protein
MSEYDRHSSNQDLITYARECPTGGLLMHDLCDRLEKADKALAQLKEMIDHPRNIYNDWKFTCKVLGDYYAKP